MHISVGHARRHTLYRQLAVLYLLKTRIIYIHIEWRKRGVFVICRRVGSVAFDGYDWTAFLVVWNGCCILLKLDFYVSVLP